VSNLLKRVFVGRSMGSLGLCMNSRNRIGLGVIASWLDVIEWSNKVKKLTTVSTRTIWNSSSHQFTKY